MFYTPRALLEKTLHMKLYRQGKLSTKILLMLTISCLLIVIFAGIVLYHSMQIEQEFHHIVEMEMSEHAASSYANMKDVDMIMATEMKINAQVELVWRGTLLLVTLLVVCGWVFAQYEIIKPIRELIDKFKRLARGEENIEFRTERVDELGELGSCFNEMNINLSQAMGTWELVMENQATTEAIVATSADAILTLDAQGTILSANAAAASILQFDSGADVEGESFPEKFLPPEHREPMTHCLAEVKAAGHSPLLNQRREIGAQHADGSTFTAEINLTQVMQKGENLFIVYLRDITDRKQAEVELQRSRDAAIDIAQTKADFMANISHELRTPMNGVLGMLSVMDHSRNKHPDLQEYIDAATHSAHDLLQLINNLVDFARLNSGRLELQTLDFSLRDLLTRISQLGHHRAGLKNLGFSEQHQLTLADHIHSDPVRLGQVLIQLIDNAIKFTERGEVSLHTEQRLRQTGQIEIIIQVRDTGQGISSDNLPKLFQAFTQLDGTRKRKQGGTGIGLTFCKQTLDLMGGHIEVASIPGQGSVFTILLPVIQAADQASLADISKLAGLEGLATTDGSTVINQRLFEELLRLLPVDDLILLINTFNNNTQQQLARLKTALGSQDSHAAFEACHSLKSGCSNLYAEAMIIACDKLIQSLQKNPSSDFKPLLDKIEQEYQRLKVALDIHLQGSSKNVSIR